MKADDKRIYLEDIGEIVMSRGGKPRMVRERNSQSAAGGIDLVLNHFYPFQRSSTILRLRSRYLTNMAASSQNTSRVMVLS
jgi:hypothetical protein